MSPLNIKELSIFVRNIGEAISTSKSYTDLALKLENAAAVLSISTFSELGLHQNKDTNNAHKAMMDRMNELNAAIDKFGEGSRESWKASELFVQAYRYYKESYNA